MTMTLPGTAPIRQLQRRYGSRAITWAVIGALIFLLFGLKPISRGLVLGALFSVINFVLIGQLLPRKLGKTRGRLYLFSLGSTALRFLLLSLPLILAVKSMRFDFVATVAGIFMVQIVILVDHVFGRRGEARGG